MDEDSSTEQKTWQVYSFGKINGFRLHLNEARESVSVGEEEGTSFHVDGTVKKVHDDFSDLQ